MRTCRRLTAAFLLAALAACVPADRPAALVTPGARAGATAAANPLAQALDRALARRSWHDLRIDTECRTDSGFTAATVYGSGVVIWDRHRQAVLPSDRVLALLAAFRRHGFDSLADRYGGRDDPAPPEAAGLAALELACRVGLRLDGAEKQVFQLAGGRQEIALRRLAEEILAAVAEVGARGEGAASLAEGLAKIADGHLAGETLVLQILEESERPEEAEEGLLLRLEAGTATAERQTPDGGPGETWVLELSAAEVSELARRLADEGLAALPGNLFATRYLDLAVEVLERKLTLQARPFAGMARETHGEAQQRFERVVELLRGLYLRAAAEGRPAR